MSSEEVPSTASTSSPPSAFSSEDRKTPPSRPSAPAATAASFRGAIAYCTLLAVVLCGLAGLLLSWLYYIDGGGVTERGGRFRPSEARRSNDSGVDGGPPSRQENGPKPRLEVAEEGNDSILSGGGDEGLTRRYSSFKEYASEQHRSAKSGSNETLGVPIVGSPDGPEACMSIPVAIIMGVQKGGTQNLRSHLLSHPLLSGYTGKEAHFFDSARFSNACRNGIIEWPGDGLDNEQPSPDVVGDVLSAYANRSMEAMTPSARDAMVGVDSTPVYIFHPLVPYRMKMVLPRAKLILLLRDPTERYFSHLRMTMCSAKPAEPFEAVEERLQTYFHNPGPEEAKQYLEDGEARYTPYTELCRGEKATSGDLERCWGRLQAHHPLHRGLYAEQLERWFRIFGREQILIVDSGEMFGDFTGTLSKVAHHAGLPPHDFEYNSIHQHSSNACERHRPELFAKGARYDKMVEDEIYFREWYRPHNQRLFQLLGREMPWE